jgi:hypothetical protein
MSHAFYQYSSDFSKRMREKYLYNDILFLAVIDNKQRHTNIQIENYSHVLDYDISVNNGADVIVVP